MEEKWGGLVSQFYHYKRSSNILNPKGKGKKKKLKLKHHQSSIINYLFIYSFYYSSLIQETKNRLTFNSYFHQTHLYT